MQILSNLIVKKQLFFSLVFPKFISHYNKKFKTRNVDKGFKYNSGLNDVFLTKDKIRKLIKENVDKNFKPF